jgi:hypothetical protein
MGYLGRVGTEGTQSRSPRPRLVCLPSSDGEFRRIVEQAVTGEIRAPWQLERELRAFYPLARVRSRELSGEQGITWYVYRDPEFSTRCG